MAGVDWRDWHAQQKTKTVVLENAAVASQPVEIPDNSYELQKWIVSSKRVAAELGTLLPPTQVQWLIHDYFFRGESMLDVMIHKPTLAREWLAYPVLVASMVLACFDVDGQLPDKALAPDGISPVIDPLRMMALERLIFESGATLTAHVAREVPSMDPNIPFACLLEAIMSVRIIQVQFARSRMQEYCVHHCLVMHIVSQWGFYRMDQPETASEPSNAYLADLWYTERAAFSSLPAWRVMFRHLLWATKVDDFNYQAIPGGVPRYTTAALALLRPLLPHSVMVEPHEDFEVLAERISPLDLRWCLLPANNPLRIAAMKRALGSEYLDAALKSISLFVSSGVGEAIWDDEVELGAFQPLHTVKAKTQCPTLETDPFRFWNEFIADVFSHLPDEFRTYWQAGDIDGFLALAREQWGPIRAAQFATHIFRLMECKVRCQVWIPPFGMVPFIRDDVTEGLEKVHKSLGREIVVAVTYGTTPRVRFSDGPDWFKSIPGSSLESILADAIVMTRLLREILSAKKSHPLVPIGQSQFSAAAQLLLIHTSVMLSLAKISAPSWIVNGTVNDVMTHMNFLKLQVATPETHSHVTGSNISGGNSTKNSNSDLATATPSSTLISGASLPQAPWMQLLYDTLDQRGEVDMEWVGRFYQLTIMDMMSPNGTSFLDMISTLM